MKGFASAHEYDGSFRTSAKTGFNINESMEFLIGKIIDRLTAISTNEFAPDERSISLDPGKHALSQSIRNKPKSGCCWVFNLIYFFSKY